MELELMFLHVESGEEVPVTFSPDANALFVFSIIKALTDNGHVVVGTSIKEESSNE